MDSPVLRARSPAEVLDAAFQVVRLQFVNLLLASGAFMLPVLLLAAVVPVSAFGIVRFLTRIGATLAAGAAIALVSDFYLGKPHGARIAIRTALSRAVVLVVIAVVKGIAIGVGLVLLIVPGVVLFAWTYSMSAAAVVEDAGPDDAWERSRELARGNVGRILLTGGLTWLLMVLASFGIGIAIGLVSGGAEFARPAIFLNAAVMAVAYPFFGIVTTLLYFDLRIRNEAFDVELAAHRLAGTVPKMKVAFW